MKYLIKAKVKERERSNLMREIAEETLGKGSVAFGEYVKKYESG